ncbi:alpha-ketoglutarate-dependent dioxygenase AlkB family protein [Kaarinaea lacus]
MRTIISTDGFASLLENFIPQQDQAGIYQTLLNEVAWHEEQYLIYGKSVTAPRLVAWYGNPEASYRYSGITHTPLHWHPLLLKLKHDIEKLCKHDFNSVLCNLYRDGNDSMGWHADKEAELGVNPYIASLSFGDDRLFKFRHNKSKQTVDVVLAGGTLLLMGGELQHHWRHALPKTKKPKQPRINLTFRKIIST